MAEERTLGLARAIESGTEEFSKNELQRRMEETRDSISSTVSEIKETVAHQVESVKEALDWREQFRKRPLAWSLGAMGVGFVTGYGIAGAIKGNQSPEPDLDTSIPHAYAAQPILGDQTSRARPGNIEGPTNGDTRERPSLFGRFRETSAYERLSQEVGVLGDRLIDELSTTAQLVVLPALLAKVKDWIGMDLSQTRRADNKALGAAQDSRTDRSSTYQPVLERPS